MTVAECTRRNFSKGFKIQKVKKLETGKTIISKIRKQYEVSYSAIY